MLTAQPFEVSKTILQVYVAHPAHAGMTDRDDKQRRDRGYRDNYYEEVCMILFDKNVHTSTFVGRLT